MTKPENDFAPVTDFLSFLPDLWRGRFLILGCTLVALVVSTAISIVLPETYESEAALLLLPPPFKEVKDEISSMIPKALFVADYEILLQSDSVLAQTVAMVKSKATPEIWPEADLLSLDEMSQNRKRFYITTEVTEKNVTSMRYSPVIRLTARAGSPRQAQQLAAAWAEVSVETAKSLYIKGKSGMLEFITSGFDNAKEELTEVNSEIRDVEIEWNDELENARLGKKHSRLLDYEEKLLDTEIKLAALTKEIEALELSQSHEEETLTIWKSPPMEAIFIRREIGAVKSSASDSDRQADAEASDKRFGYEEQVLNQTYFDTEGKLVVKRSELSGLQEARRQYEDAITQMNSELQDMRRESAVRNYERKILDIQVAPLKNAYELLAAKVEQVKVVESELHNLADIKVIAEAQVPDRKVAPMRSIIMAGGMILAFVCAVGFVVGRSLLLKTGLKFSA